MVFVKPTVGISRLAGTAFKSFTHGYAQTVVAASQSSYASQNTGVTPLASNWIHRIGGNTSTSQLQHVPTHASTQAARQDNNHNDGLAQYYEAWHKHHKNGDLREWQQFQFQKLIGYSSAAAVESKELDDVQESSAIEEVDESLEDAPQRGKLKRAYTTSAVDNFGKAIDNQEAAAIAFAQVNEAIAEEISKTKQEVEAAVAIEEDAVSEKTITPAQGDQEQLLSDVHDNTVAAPISELDAYTQELETMLRDKQYSRIPSIFESMLYAGVRQPPASAYRALMTSAIELTTGKHQKVPKALEVYSDMLRRRVIPDAETYTALIDLLANRALEASATKKVLEEKRLRYGGMEAEDSFLFHSDALEYAIFAEDESLSIALTTFNSASTKVDLSTKSYGLLIHACAKQGRVSDMTRLFEHMSGKDIVPNANIFPAMINAFALAGDLRNAVDCYDNYKKLAIENDAGLNSMSRMDEVVYSSLIKAYASCQHLNGGQKFLREIESQEQNAFKRQAIRDTVYVESFLPLSLQTGNFKEASAILANVSSAASVHALNAIIVAAADTNNSAESTKAFNALAAVGADLAPSSMAMLAMHVRNANLDAAEPYWRVLENSMATPAFIEPATMRALALISVGFATRGIAQTRHMLSRIRDAQNSASANHEIAEKVEEAIEVLGSFALKNNNTLELGASVELLRMMVDNGALVNPIAEHLVASFGSQEISQLNPSDIGLLTKIQSRMILDESAPEIAGDARFTCLLENIVSRAILPDVSTENLIEKTLINLDRSDLSRLWNNYRYPVLPSPVYPPVVNFNAFPQAPMVPVSPVFDDAFDPYASRTDNKASVAITDLLEKPHGKSASNLNEALAKFRNIRRAGRVPRFFAYSKLITAAAKENQFNLCRDILEMAKQDVPFLPQYRVVRFGWVSILDSMLSACLTVGRRDLAAQYHQDLLNMGASPSANTYGLYITTLKENTKTFDEATEAVKIFLRAKAEGVEPTSFLYNALIGKLGKARRIDDCLFYFAEMRNLGIRPTSVTYGTIVNALCRVSDEKFAEEIFEEMEACANYKPRPAPYHSLMQHFLTTKRDRSKVLSYYERMRSKGIQPTMHTYKLLIDTHATLEPLNMAEAESILAEMRAAGEKPEAVHYAALIHAKGCVQQDMAGARALFETVASDSKVKLQPCVYQAMFEALVANRQVADAEPLLAHMAARRVEMTPYIANALIHGWALEKDIVRARQAFDRVNFADREPSTYEAMVRAYLAVEDREGAQAVVGEALSRGYPTAVANKIVELISGGRQ
ncbi:pentatricopeptide repeat protein, partial [Aureobasidium melanogenum]